MLGSVHWELASGLWVRVACDGLWGATAPIVDRNGTVYVGVKYSVYALSSDGRQLWRYQGESQVEGLATGSGGTTNASFGSRLVAFHDAE